MKQLDVGLHYFIDYAKTVRLMKEWDDFHSKTFEDIAKGKDKLTDEDYVDLRRKVSVLSKELGLSDKGEDYKNVSRIELPSAIHADHPFKIGTFVDTMDDMALSTVLGNLGIPTIHGIFSDQVNYGAADGGIQFIQPDWTKCFDKVCDAITMLDSYISANKGFMVSTVALPVDILKDSSKLSHVPVSTPMDALAMYQEQVAYALRKGIDKNYYNSFGWFYTKKALSIRASIAGVKEIDGMIVPCTYIIFNTDMEWYRQALEIIRETITYVLSSSEDVTKYWLKFETFS
jgi:hypothetical protein